MHEVTKRHQFFMKLQITFEHIRSNLMNSEFIPTLDGCLDELLRNEQQFITRSSLEQHQSQVAPVSVAYVSQGKFKPRDISSLQCHSCKVFGHIILECHKKV